MSGVYKLKFASLENVLKQTFGLGDEDNLELEVKEREAVIKVVKSQPRQLVKTTAQSLLDFMDSLPEPTPGEEPTDYASQVDHFLYQRDRHF